MGFFNIKKKEVRDINTNKASNQLFLETLTGTAPTIDVSENTALNIPAVSSSVDLISSIVSMLDLRLYKKIKCDKVEEIEQDYRLNLLNLEPNYLMNSSQLKKAIVQDVLLHGASYINIARAGNKIDSLYFVNNASVNVVTNTGSIKKDATISVDGKTYECFDFVIPTLNTKDGVTGNGALKRNRELILLALLEQKYVNTVYANGGAKKGYFTSERKLVGDAFTEFKQAVKEIYKDAIPDFVFNAGVSYTPITNSNVEMQVLESRKFVNQEIKSIFNIPNNLDENGYKTLVRVTLIPIINALENAINKALLLQKEKEQGYYFKFDLRELTRANIKERFEAYKLALDGGIKTINEVRADENLESIDGLDITKFNLAHVIFNAKTKEFYTPNTGQLKNQDANKEAEKENIPKED